MKSGTKEYLARLLDARSNKLKRERFSGSSNNKHTVININKELIDIIEMKKEIKEA